MTRHFSFSIFLIDFDMQEGWLLSSWKKLNFAGEKHLFMVGAMIWSEKEKSKVSKSPIFEISENLKILIIFRKMLELWLKIRFIHDFLPFARFYGEKFSCDHK